MAAMTTLHKKYIIALTSCVSSAALATTIIKDLCCDVSALHTSRHVMLYVSEVAAILVSPQSLVLCWSSEAVICAVITAPPRKVDKL